MTIRAFTEQDIINHVSLGPKTILQVAHHFQVSVFMARKYLLKAVQSEHLQCCPFKTSSHRNGALVFASRGTLENEMRAVLKVSTTSFDRVYQCEFKS